ncbi:late embryogenesis abundant protein [Striga asiatica]|uniref:Late embryogenesis abundant protein n=1 Tax=Striga asiatica TaxID=4170 RepID=A0A5A7Q9J5_STRAF|nr:late embryogenesis abundant protein [Striga asiatica]
MGGTKQPQLNGGFYGPAVLPPKKNYHRPGRGGGGCCCNPFSCCCGCLVNCICTCVFQIILTILIVVGIVVFVLWLVFRPNTVRFHATGASLTEFSLDGNNTLRYDLTVNLTIRNPNSRIGIYYDRIEARALYQGQRFASVDLQRFYQGHKSTREATAVFRGTHLLPLGSRERSRYDANSRDGAFDIDVRLYLRTRLKFWFVKSPRVKPNIECDLRRIPLRSNGNVSGAAFEPTRRMID